MTRRPILYAAPAFAVGAFLSWLITADLYGLDAVQSGDWKNGYSYHCIDLSYATPEQDLTDDMFERIRNHWSKLR